MRFVYERNGWHPEIRSGFLATTIRVERFSTQNNGGGLENFANYDMWSEAMLRTSEHDRIRKRTKSRHKAWYTHAHGRRQTTRTQNNLKTHRALRGRQQFKTKEK